MKKTISTKQLGILVKLSNEYASKGKELDKVFCKLVEAVAVTCKVTTYDDAKALSEQVADSQHGKVYGNLTKADVKLADSGELDKEGFTKAGKRIGITEVQGVHTRNAWNTILRAYKAGVSLLDNGKGKSYHVIRKDIIDATVTPDVGMNAKLAAEMKDNILKELTKIAHDIKKYKGAREGLENGLIGIMEEVFGYDFS